MELLAEIVDTIQNISDGYNDESGFTNNDSFVNTENQSRFHLLQGFEYFKNGDIEKSKKEFLISLKFDKNSIDANFNLGVLFRDEKNYRQSLIYFTKCRQFDSENFTILFNIAFCNEMMKQYDNAIKYYELAEELSDNNATLYFNLGNIYKRLKDWRNAKLNYDKAIAIDPNNTNYLVNNAVVFYFTGAFNQAISIYNKIFKLEPDNFSAKINYAAALVEVEKFKDSLEIYNSLLKTNYNDTELHYNLAVLLLLQRDYKQGFQEYEWRLTNEEKYNSYPEIPYWKGEKLTGKSIVVIDEQGIGDAFQFVRYLKLLKEDGAEVIYSCRQSLVSFMESAQVADNVIPLKTPIEADYKIYMMSLPLKYLSVFNSTKFEFPYLNFDKNLNKNCTIDVDKQKLNIGIVWRGNPEHKYDFKRSVNIESFLPVLSVENTKVFSLQNDITDEEKGILNSNNIIDLSPMFQGFVETSKIFNQLDLIISVDTAAAHLAGALNKKTFLLLSKVPDWRWGLDSVKTKLYPSIRLFRQKNISGWSNVFEEVKKSIKNLVRTNSENQSNVSADLMEIKLRGIEAIEQKKYVDAVEILEDYVKQIPNDFEISFWLSLSYFELNEFDKAKKILLKVEKTNIQQFATLELLGKIYLQKNDFASADNYYLKALNINESIDSLNGLGVSLQKQGKFAKAQKYFAKAISIYPNIAGNQLNYANNCYYMNNFDEAIIHFDIAIKLENLSAAHIGKSFVLLTQKLFQKGFDEYEWGLTKFTPPEGTKAVKWNGQQAEGKNIFIYAEQGLGDSIQFSRFLVNVKNKGLNITLFCNEPLRKLFELNPFVDKIQNQISPEIDYYSSIINLPKVLGLEREENFALPDGLLNIDKKLIRKWSSRINRKKLNVGLVWESKSKSETTECRSIPFDVVEPLLKIENVDFCILQKEYDTEVVDLLMNKYSNIQIINKDFLNVAAIIENVDVVITVDSVVAHIAGILNKETWVLLPFVSDWRWQYSGDSSYWYPSVKLFRQNKFNGWDGVILNVKTALKNKAELFAGKDNFGHSKIDEIKKLLDANKLGIAKKELLSLLQESPTNVEANFYLGYVNQLQNNLKDAASNYSKVLSAEPVHFDALNNLGVVLKDLGQFSQAKEFLNYALIVKNNNPSVYNNLGIVNDLLGNFAEAITNFERSLSSNPNYEESLLNFANTLQTVKRYTEALQVLNKLLKINPQNVGGNFNKSLTLLSSGDYKNGFKFYEWRRKRNDFYPRNFSKPELTNQAVDSKTILVYDEQGLGDTIQFCRYIQLLADKKAKVILQCHSDLSGLLSGCSGVDSVIARESLNDPAVDYNYHIPLLSLPKYFGTKLDSIPTVVPYISVPDKLINEFHSKYFDNEKINIGIVWEGKTPVGNAQRACTLNDFESLIGEKCFKFFSLQKGEVAVRDKQKMKDFGIIDLSSELATFKETAAIIKNLNLVITIDTSVAHISGALGAKTYTLLSYKTDWRWQNSDDYSIWYPQMKLIKQLKFGEWNNVFEKIKFLLKKNETDFVINNN